MPKHGKKFAGGKKQVETRHYAVDEAIATVRKAAFAKFDDDPRGGDASRGRSEARRPDGPRHGGRARR